MTDRAMMVVVMGAAMREGTTATATRVGVTTVGMAMKEEDMTDTATKEEGMDTKEVMIMALGAVMAVTVIAGLDMGTTMGTTMAMTVTMAMAATALVTAKVIMGTASHQASPPAPHPRRPPPR